LAVWGVVCVLMGGSLGLSCLHSWVACSAGLECGPSPSWSFLRQGPPGRRHERPPPGRTSARRCRPAFGISPAVQGHSSEKIISSGPTDGNYLLNPWSCPSSAGENEKHNAWTAACMLAKFCGGVWPSCKEWAGEGAAFLWQGCVHLCKS
jgi:hypothetical protein